MSGRQKTTHLLTSDQQDGALFGVDHLPENVVKDEEFAPAVLQQLHLVVHLVREKHCEVLFRIFFFYFDNTTTLTIATYATSTTTSTKTTTTNRNDNDNNYYIPTQGFLCVLVPNLNYTQFS